MPPTPLGGRMRSRPSEANTPVPVGGRRAAPRICVGSGAPCGRSGPHGRVLKFQVR